MTTVMDRSLAQRREALNHANAIRVYRAELKRQVASSAAPYNALLDRMDPRLQSMRLVEALRCMPAIGTVIADKVMQRAAISPRARIGGISPQAWARLYVALESYPSVARRLSEARGTLHT